MAQQSLYYRTQLESKVSLLPEQINSEIDENLLNNLKTKIEGYTIDCGIVIKIIKLVNYDYGIIEKANFMGTTVFNIRYECYLCAPIKDLEIICLLENIVKGYMIGKNGPIVVAIQLNNYDSQLFDLVDNDIISKKTKKKIIKGDYLKVSIINIKNNLGEKNITTLCKLLNIASEEEIKNFVKDQKIVDDDEKEDKIFI